MVVLSQVQSRDQNKDHRERPRDHEPLNFAHRVESKRPLLGVEEAARDPTDVEEYRDAVLNEYFDESPRFFNDFLVMWNLVEGGLRINFGCFSRILNAMHHDDAVDGVAPHPVCKVLPLRLLFVSL